MQHAWEELLAPLDGESPAGPDLEYDPEFLELQRISVPKQERAMGDSVIAAEEPDWEKVSELAEALFQRTKDLRVAMPLIAAWLKISGMTGWAAGLAVVRGLIENFWETVHPKLDADDDNDPTFRVNSVAGLGDAQGTLRYFRLAPFVASPRLGRFCLRDLRIANGSLKVAAVETSEDGAAPKAQPTQAEIDAACRDCPEEQLTETLTALNLALECAKAIGAAFDSHLGAAGPDLKALQSDIFELKKYVETQHARRMPQADAEDDDEDSPSATGSSGGSGGGSGGRVASAEDVIRRLDELCDYYSRVEPSSPVPLLLRRAQRLVGKDFTDLLRDLAPGALGQLQVISGAPAAGTAGAADASDDE